MATGTSPSASSSLEESEAMMIGDDVNKSQMIFADSDEDSSIEDSDEEPINVDA